MKSSKIKTLCAALGIACGAMAGNSANAFSISSGDYKMTVDAYINGTLYSQACGGDAVSLTNIGDCDSNAAVAAYSGFGSEDSWGILSVSSITNTTTNTTMFARVTDGYLIGYVTGLTDFKSKQLDTDFQKDYATGGSINLYHSASDYDPTVSTANRAAVLASVTNLPLYLSLDFVTGAGFSATDAAVALASYVSTFDQATGLGSGSGYLAVTGGDAMAQFDTNTYTTAAGFSADAHFTTTIGFLTAGDTACTSTGGNPSDIPQTCNWLAGPTLDVRGHSIPEPTSLALLGVSMLGLSALRRRKSK